ncbi:MAG: histone [Nitrososphaera sp.]|jgi:histone H3/H4
MTTSEFGLSVMYRILKKAGAERVSDESANELRRILEEIGTSIAKSAVDMSVHAGRKTIKSEDIRLAAKQFAKF